MMFASFNGNPCKTIDFCYSSINASDKTHIITFYKELSSVVRDIPKHNVLIIGGAQMRKYGNNKFF